MKVLSIISLFIVITSQTLAQKSNIYFLKDDGRPVASRDSADFIRIIQEPDSTNSFFKVLEFYPDNSRKFVGRVSSFEPKMVYEGATMLYNKNGKKSAQVSYLLGIPFGVAYYFYPDGRVKKEIDFTPEAKVVMNDHNQSDKSRLIAFFDTTGTQVVKEGNGYAIVTGEDEMLSEEGKYSLGCKDSIWKGFYKESGRFYEEVYKDGILISGLQTFQNGHKFSYTKLNEPAQFSNGERQFPRFLAMNFKYPKEAIERGISGKMAIHLNINADGTVTDISILPSLDFSINREVIRVIKSTGKWIPAKLRGEPINSNHEVNFGLKLGPTTIIRQETRQIPNGIQSPQVRRSF